MNPGLTDQILYKLREMEGLKIESRDGGFQFEYQGLSFNGCYLTAPESFFECYIFFQAHLLAREIVKSASITLP